LLGGVFNFIELIKMAEKNKRKVMEKKIIEKARTDKAFKKELLENPAGALKKLFGFDIPANIKISVLEEKTDHLYVVLPVNPDDIELPADMVKKIAGGICGCEEIGCFGAGCI